MARFRITTQFEFESDKKLHEIAGDFAPVVVEEATGKNWKYAKLHKVKYLQFEAEELDYPKVDIEKL